ncbi:MAG TPA: hypothetical protein VEG39_10905 [Clostridia bacterium]|nr:hypothetical protein [Clostridia bacterium]
MPGKEVPKGSFKDGRGKWWVACWECLKGVNGDSSCSAGIYARSLSLGCLKGQLLDKYLPNQEGGKVEE